MLKRDLVLALDPVAFVRAAGLQPDPWQVEALRSKSDRILLNCSRQAGKSTITAALAVHTALYEGESLTLLLSPSLRQSQELFRKALEIYYALDQPVSMESQSALRLELKNGSRIVSLPGKQQTVRGFSGVSLLAVDEAAQVPDELYMSARPMLAVSGGRLIALSTPYGARGWWYEAWRSPHDWQRFEVPAAECPRISQEFLDEEMENLGEWWFRQEYQCEFMEAEEQAFRTEDIEAAFSEEVEPWTM